MRLRTKYSAAVLGIAVSVVLLLSITVVFLSRQTLDQTTRVGTAVLRENLLEEFRKRAVALGTILAADLSNAVYLYDMEAIHQLVRPVRQQPDVLYVYVFDDRGRIIHDAQRTLPQFGKVLDDTVTRKVLVDQKMAIRNFDGELVVTTPIFLHNELLGGIRIAFSLEEITLDMQGMSHRLASQYQNLERHEMLAFFLAAGFLCILSVGTAFVLARSWSKPIALLSDLTKQVGRGDYDVEVPIQASDEIGDLASAFQRMVADLKTSKDSERQQSNLLAEAYRKLQQANHDLVKASNAKDEFLSVVSHELRTPLNVIMGYTEMLRDRLLGAISAEQEQALGNMAVRSKELLELIGGILDVTSLESGSVRLNRTPVNVAEFMEDLKSLYDQPLGKEISVAWHWWSDPPVVEFDASKLRHILQNLINNAIKFSGKGTVTISARYSAATEKLEFQVKDEGPGIPRESLETIFEKFRQLDGGGTRSRGGVGIGLYLVKQLTTLMGGEVIVESEVGKGSVFRVTLPCKPCLKSARELVTDVEDAAVSKKQQQD